MGASEKLQGYTYYLFFSGHFKHPECTAATDSQSTFICLVSMQTVLRFKQRDHYHSGWKKTGGGGEVAHIK